MSAIARLVLGRDRTDGHILGSSRNVVAVELITRRVSHANAVDAHKTFRFGIRSRIAHLEDVGLAPRTESLGIEVELEVVLEVELRRDDPVVFICTISRPVLQTFLPTVRSQSIIIVCQSITRLRINLIRIHHHIRHRREFVGPWIHSFKRESARFSSIAIDILPPYCARRIDSEVIVTFKVIKEHIGIVPHQHAVDTGLSRLHHKVERLYAILMQQEVEREVIAAINGDRSIFADKSAERDHEIIIGLPYIVKDDVTILIGLSLIDMLSSTRDEGRLCTIGLVVGCICGQVDAHLCIGLATNAVAESRNREDIAGVDSLHCIDITTLIVAGPVLLSERTFFLPCGDGCPLALIGLCGRSQAIDIVAHAVLYGLEGFVSGIAGSLGLYLRMAEFNRACCLFSRFVAEVPNPIDISRIFLYRVGSCDGTHQEIVVKLIARLTFQVPEVA